MKKLQRLFRKRIALDELLRELEFLYQALDMTDSNEYKGFVRNRAIFYADHDENKLQMIEAKIEGRLQELRSMYHTRFIAIHTVLEDRFEAKNFYKTQILLFKTDIPRERSFVEKVCAFVCQE